MEEAKYLTKELKEYYSEDFQKLLSFKDSEFWDIDEGLVDILSQINANTEIQTLYSKRWKPNPEYLSAEAESYLQITFSKQLEPVLISRLTKLQSNFLCNNAEIEFFVQNPTSNVNIESAQIGLGCTTNPNYFMVKHIVLKLNSFNPKCHSIFWEKIKETLSFQ